MRIHPHLRARPTKATPRFPPAAASIARPCRPYDHTAAPRSTRSFKSLSAGARATPPPRYGRLRDLHRAHGAGASAPRPCSRHRPPTHAGPWGESEQMPPSPSVSFRAAQPTVRGDWHTSLGPSTYLFTSCYYCLLEFGRLTECAHVSTVRVVRSPVRTTEVRTARRHRAIVHHRCRCHRSASPWHSDRLGQPSPIRETSFS
ncbi:hypothetical protein OH76DRAFT_437730 [Lentinus brumalis]|uniref:Uncharacterized protein n=1 Tax=Lentinus brumalis TaxID=2498619 RepID=A0A371DDW1_9APHY|nr:hypothetical protein OH76DRAFT_437730 [Polyporus brumalis]